MLVSKMCTAIKTSYKSVYNWLPLLNDFSGHGIYVITYHGPSGKDSATSSFQLVDDGQTHEINI